jgi:hypothetical protein
MEEEEPQLWDPIDTSTSTSTGQTMRAGEYWEFLIENERYPWKGLVDQLCKDEHGVEWAYIYWLWRPRDFGDDWSRITFIKCGGSRHPPEGELFISCSLDLLKVAQARRNLTERIGVVLAPLVPGMCATWPLGHRHGGKGRGHKNWLNELFSTCRDTHYIVWRAYDREVGEIWPLAAYNDDEQRAGRFKDVLEDIVDGLHNQCMCEKEKAEPLFISAPDRSNDGSRKVQISSTVTGRPGSPQKKKKKKKKQQLVQVQLYCNWEDSKIPSSQWISKFGPQVREDTPTLEPGACYTCWSMGLERGYCPHL